MLLSGIGKRYAVALFNAATNQEITEQVTDDINAFAKVVSDQKQFRNFLMSPTVDTPEKKDMLQAVIGDRASGLFLKFITLLVDKKRLGALQEIADAYTYLWEEQQGIIEVKCVTAIPLDHDLQTKTRQIIEEKSGRKCRLTTITNPDIIGGMILFADDKIIDGSIRNELERMRRSLHELKVH
jgi:F-type H+-transporting ATPase subunit delta